MLQKKYHYKFLPELSLRSWAPVRVKQTLPDHPLDNPDNEVGDGGGKPANRRMLQKECVLAAGNDIYPALKFCPQTISIPPLETMK